MIVDKPKLIVRPKISKNPFMYISKVNIENYKCFDGKFTLELNQGINILVGNNEAGKSTILEAIHIALSGLLNGRYLRNGLTQYLFNNSTEKKYIDSLVTDNPLDPPCILIEVFFGADYPLFEGNNNSDKTKACGVFLKIEFDNNYKTAYENLIDKPDEVKTIPIEYYKITWRSFARDGITSQQIPIKSVIIDSTSTRLQNGSDIYISRIIRNELEESEKVEISQAYRKLKEAFNADPAVRSINNKVDEKANISDKTVTISVDLSTKDAWETGLTTYLDDVPFHHIGKGEQCIIKTNLSLGNEKSKKAGLILLEEPENHLSHTKLNQFIRSIQENSEGKQILISTHNSFVANKLGLENLIFLNNGTTLRLNDLEPKTQDFFKKLPGYQTLRLLLCKKAVLVEGDSDELVVQRAFMDSHEGHLPIENGIDVISVGLSFKRFLEIAKMLGIKTAVVTDNDKNYKKNIKKKYKDYKDSKSISIFADKREELKTLEPQFVDANNDQLELLCKVLKINYVKYNTEKKIVKCMTNNKASWALKVFITEEKLNFPEYIENVVKWCDEK